MELANLRKTLGSIIHQALFSKKPQKNLLAFFKFSLQMNTVLLVGVDGFAAVKDSKPSI